MHGLIAHHQMLSDGTCRLGSIFVSSFVRLVRLCECFFPLMIPDCLFLPLEFDSRRLTAVLVEHSSNVLEPVFCLVTEQRLSSTTHQRAQVDESYRTKFLVREFLAKDVLSSNCHTTQRWHTHVLIVSSTTATGGSRGSTRAKYVQHQHNYYMRQAATQLQFCSTQQQALSLLYTFFLCKYILYLQQCHYKQLAATLQI